MESDTATSWLPLNVVVTFALACIAIALLRMSDASHTGITQVYRLGDWPAPFGIVLVLDRLSALMLLLTSILALAALVFSLARWHRAGAHFHPLFQFLLMGLNGAFLTGDLFNLFVFFELLLAASYGLLLHGSGLARVKAGLHYIVVNLVASLLFLIGVSLIYGVTGTLNMADLAARVPTIAADNRGLLEAGAGILAMAFLLKAGMWPLCFWLPTAYAAASPPVASIFAIMTKVGVYIVLRLSLLLFGEGAGASAGFGSELVVVGRVGDDRIRRNRNLGIAGHGPSRRFFSAGILRNGAGRHRDGSSRCHRWSALLPGQFDARHQRVLPSGRAYRARPRTWGGHDCRYPGSLWRRG